MAALLYMSHVEKSASGICVSNSKQHDSWFLLNKPCSCSGLRCLARFCYESQPKENRFSKCCCCCSHLWLLFCIIALTKLLDLTTCTELTTVLGILVHGSGNIKGHSSPKHASRLKHVKVADHLYACKDQDVQVPVYHFHFFKAQGMSGKRP